MGSLRVGHDWATSLSLFTRRTCCLSIPYITVCICFPQNWCLSLYFWLGAVFVAVRSFLFGERGLLFSCGVWASSVAASLWSMGFRTPGLYSTGSIAVVNQLSCSAACGIFPDRGSNPCLLHWQGDSLPLSHQGSPSQRFHHLFKPTLLISSHQGSPSKRFSYLFKPTLLISFPSSLQFHVDYLL